MKKYAFTVLIGLIAFSACKNKAKEKNQVEPTKVEQQTKDTVQTATVQPVAEPVAQTPEDKYFLIAGSFLNQEYANSYEDRLKQKGYDAQVVQRQWGANNEYYRVACKSFYNKTDAYNALAEMQQTQEIENVWLLVK